MRRDLIRNYGGHQRQGRFDAPDASLQMRLLRCVLWRIANAVKIDKAVSAVDRIEEGGPQIR
jgi:hypothetical protein